MKTIASKISLHALPSRTLRLVVSLHHRANPGYWARVGNRTQAYLTITDGWGSIKDAYFPFLQEAIANTTTH